MKLEKKLLVTQVPPKEIDKSLTDYFIYNEEKFKKREKKSPSPKKNKKILNRLKAESPSKHESEKTELELSKEQSHTHFHEAAQKHLTEQSGPQIISSDIMIFPDDRFESNVTPNVQVRKDLSHANTSLAYTPKSSFEDPQARPLTKDLVKTLASKFALESGKVSPQRQKSKSPAKQKGPSQFTYVFDPVTDELNEKGEYQTSFDMFIRKVQPFDDPFEIINEKYQKAVNKQIAGYGLGGYKKNHMRDVIKGVKAPSRPQTAKSSTLKALPASLTNLIVAMSF
jgi:hypothetical protein